MNENILEYVRFNDNIDQIKQKYILFLCQNNFKITLLVSYE
jgi:hypothetical protein